MQQPLKKIVVIGPCYPYRGGIATFVSYLCNLLQQSYDVTLINYSMLYPSILFPGKTQYDESKDLVFSFNNQRLFSSLNPISWWRTAKKIKEIQPDIIIMDWWNPFFGLCFRGLYWCLNKKYKNRILIIAENVVSHEGRKIDAFLTKLGITIGSSYVVLSDKVRDQIKGYSGNKTIYKSNLPIYDGFDKSTIIYQRNEVCKTISNDNYVLLFFGYIRKYKGLDIALNALPHIIKSVPNVKLLIVGECYDDWAEYQKIIDDNNLQSYIEVVNDYVPNEAVEKYFNISDLVLLPYRTATQSGILNIAYGFNKPVIANRVGGFAEFILEGKTGMLVNNIDAAEYANAVIYYYNNYRHIDVTPHIKTVADINSFDAITTYVQSFFDAVNK
jgi:glycosyltransferase involved in cell wall biosynthesis